MQPPLDGGVLITGASSGIGEALARQLATRAARLVLVARRHERLHALAAELRGRRASLEVEVRPCDLADRLERDRLLDALRRGPAIDVLVNNAGVGDQSLLERARWEKLERMIELNVTAPTHLCHRLVPGMVERGRGGVLDISSSYGLTWMPGVSVYVGTKHFLTGFTESLRAEVAPTGVVVSQVCPGPVITEFHDNTESTTGHRAPRFLAISAEQCAAEALAGFERGRALIIPGWRMRTMMRLQAAMPRGLWRHIAGRMAGPMRAAGAD